MSYTPRSRSNSRGRASPSRNASNAPSQLPYSIKDYASHPATGMAPSLDSADTHLHTAHNASTTSLTALHTSPQQSSYPYFNSGSNTPPRQQTLGEKSEKVNFAPKPPLSRNTTGQPGWTKSMYSTPNDSLFGFAEGDAFVQPKGTFAKIMSFWPVRWAVFILPVLFLLWIPGIVGLTLNTNARVYGVKLLFWSCWLTVVWLGAWVAKAAAGFVPPIMRSIIGLFAPEMRHWFDYLVGASKYLAIMIWALANWVLFQPLINIRAPPSDTASGNVIHKLTQFLFGVFVCSLILLGEKLVIQAVAFNFHRTSYREKISAQKAQIRQLTTLYVNSRDLGRTDTLDNNGKTNPVKAIKKVFKSAKRAVQIGASTTLGSVASEIIGERVLQANSPQAMVTSALSSASRSRHLARRLFYSFVPSHRQAMLVEDLVPFFQTYDQAQEAFNFFDSDENGDASLEEAEMAVLELHRDRISLAASMRDLDSAVGHLDSILMGVFYLVCIIVIVSLLDTSFNTMVVSFSTTLLGLSWLIGTTAQEVLASVIFLLAKHVYDVGDRVDIDGNSYVVKEIYLLSTVFRQTDGKIVQMPHNVLAAKPVTNIQRSGAITESFTFDIDFSTPFEKIEALRQAMLDYVEKEKRDFFPTCDLRVMDFVEQGRLSVKASIAYKSNWQNGVLYAQRRNKWVCALKIHMANLQIFGPAGAGNPTPDPADPTLIKLLSDNPHNVASHIHRDRHESDAPPYASTGKASPDNMNSVVAGFAARDGALAHLEDNVVDGDDGRRQQITQEQIRLEQHAAQARGPLRGGPQSPPNARTTGQDIEMGERRH